MKRRVLSFLILGFSAVAIATASSPASAHIIQSGTIHAGVSDFTFDSFSADYYLGLDSGGHSTLKTVETLVAEFPTFDQSHGIIRALVTDYDGHPTDTSVISVTDENGKSRPWHDATSSESSGNSGFRELVLAGSNYVQGKQTYVVTYTQSNVTSYFADTKDDEFYWDTNGTGWAQPFGSVTARVHLGNELASHFHRAAACYQGSAGSATSCPITKTEDQNGGLVFTANAENLGPGQNVTVALGFSPGTFTPRDSSYFASFFGWLQAIAVASAALTLVWVIRLRRTVFRDAPGRPTIIAEYGPPKNTTVVDAAIVIKKMERAAAAMIVGLAVRKNLRIIESDSKSWLSNKPTYTLEITSLDGLTIDESDFLSIFFDDVKVGSEYALTSSDTARSKAVYQLLQAEAGAIVSKGLRAKISAGSRFWPFLATTGAAVATFVFGLMTIGDARGGAVPFVLNILAVIIEIIMFAVIGRKPLTSQGAEFRDHLEGLRLYIRLAEADRIRVLQSPQGAERAPVSTSDPRQMLLLSEKLLPYAVLFSLEKEWAAEIGKYYDGSSPDWYSGSGAFNAGLFAASIGSFSTTTASSFSGSSSSSSSGGSGGGGSSGGGGGGGGGGGI